MIRCRCRATLVYTQAVRRILDWVMGVAEALGSPGLFLLALLDSSFLSFPQVVDVLLMGLAAKYPERTLWYALLPTVGSIAGSYVLYTLALRGGEAFVRRRLQERHIERAFEVFRKYGLLAVAVPAILPPPVPFKVFVLAAGASGMKRVDFVVAVSIGRGVRYFGEGLLAAWYGETALRGIKAFFDDHRTVAISTILIAAGAFGAWIWRRAQAPSS
jgi:membrane protein YqaA with SNARE-associated domain